MRAWSQFLAGLPVPLVRRVPPAVSRLSPRSLAVLAAGNGAILAWLVLFPADVPGWPSLVLTVDPDGPVRESAPPAPASALEKDDSAPQAAPDPPMEAAAEPTDRDSPQQRALPTGTESAPADPGTMAALRDGALEPVPDLGLIEEGPDGFLPRIGIDGRRPDRVYARPFDDSHDRPRIALLITDVGLGQAASETAVTGLPPEVSLAVSPYAAFPQLWTNRARAHGHEVLLAMPMEPYGYPENDPGPHALLTRLPAPERLVRLNRLLSSTTGYAGVVNELGGAFLASAPDLTPVLAALGDRGLFFLDDGGAERSVAAEIAAARDMGFARADRRLDARPSRRNVDLALLELEAVARAKGRAIGVGRALPVTVARIRVWAPTLAAKGLVLAPVSAMMATSHSREGSQHAALVEP